MSYLEMEINSLCHYLYKNYQKYPHKQWLFAKQKENYEGHSYSDILSKSIALYQTLQKKGIKKNDHVAIFSYNCIEWIIIDYALMLLEAISVPLYHGLVGSELKNYIDCIDIKYAFVQTIKHKQQLSSCLAITNQLVPITVIKEGVDDLEALISDELKNLNNIESYEKKILAVNSDQVVTMMFSSGTSAKKSSPVQLTHRNILTNINDIKQLFGTTFKPSDRLLSFLPMSHIFARTVDHYVSLVFCHSVYFIPSMDDLKKELTQINPSILVFVPRVLEKIYNGIFSKATKKQKKIIEKALKYSQAYHDSKGLKKGLYAIGHGLATFIIYRKIIKKISKNLKFMIVGGAPSIYKVESFFRNIGVNIFVGYGLTETSPVIAVRTPQQNKLGTVGTILPSLTVKIMEDKELWVKGDSVSKGFYKDPLSQQMHYTKDNWFKTGDLVEYDTEGNLIICGRKKQLIVLSNGKKIIPTTIEHLLVTHEHINQVCVVGEGFSYLIAIIVANPMEQLQLSTQSHIQVLEEVVKAALANYPDYMNLKHIIVINDEFTYENGFLTYTKKLKRSAILDYFKHEIDQVYQQKRSIKTYVKK